MNKEIYKLQNGTDIRGIAYKNNQKEVNLTNKEAKLIASSFCKWLRKKLGKEELKISIGRDSRITGEELKKVFIETLVSENVEVINCSMSTTPAMFMSTIIDGYKCDGAVMITASHLPYYYNGFKFFTKDGGLEKQDIKDILDLCNENKFTENKKGRVIEKNLINDYSDILVEKIRKAANSKKNFDKPLEGLNIIVDAGNGAGGFFAEKVLQRLGADTKGSQFLNPDGMFPNHIPNPENKEAMKSICEAVIKNKSDLGIIFDTDVDRAGLVDKKGQPINKNSLIALISAIVLEEYPDTTIVTDSVTSDGLEQFIIECNGKHHRFKRGYKNVINEAIRLNKEHQECHLAIETSGHAAIKENYFLDDGAYLVSKILVKVAKLAEENIGIEKLIENLEKAKDEKEVRIHINTANYISYAQNILDDLNDYIENVSGWKKCTKNYEGVRVNCHKDSGDGWFLLRLSLHEPLLVLNIESNKINGTEEIYKTLKVFLSKYELLNL